MQARQLIGLGVLLGMLVFAWSKLRDVSSTAQPNAANGVTIDKRPVNFTSRAFDPERQPADMPPLSSGEEAECDSNFLSSASVRGETRETDATHGIVRITHVTVTLNLNITIWVPTQVSQHVIAHEEGHRQISEYYYRTADKLAQQIAATYIGRQADITGTDLNAESDKLLHQVATEITDEYNKELNTEPTQLLYDSITDHGRNEIPVKDAVDHAIKNVAVE